MKIRHSPHYVSEAAAAEALHALARLLGELAARESIAEQERTAGADDDQEALPVPACADGTGD